MIMITNPIIVIITVIVLIFVICNHHNHSHVIDIHMMSMHRSILNQTTDGNVIQAFKEYSLDPKSRFANPVKIFSPVSHLWKLRYKTIPKKFDQEKIYQYYDSDNPEEVNIWHLYHHHQNHLDNLDGQVDFLKERFKEKKFFNNEEHKGLLKKVKINLIFAVI